MTYPEKYRITVGPLSTSAGNPGMFFVTLKKKHPKQRKDTGMVLPNGDPHIIAKQEEEILRFQVVASDADGWDRINISLPEQGRTPYPDEVEYIKGIFFGDELALQMHFPKGTHPNGHPLIVCLWKKQGFEYPLPPDKLLGIKPSTDGNENKEAEK